MTNYFSVPCCLAISSLVCYVHNSPSHELDPSTSHLSIPIFKTKPPKPFLSQLAACHLFYFIPIKPWLSILQIGKQYLYKSSSILNYFLGNDTVERTYIKRWVKLSLPLLFYPFLSNHIVGYTVHLVTIQWKIKQYSDNLNLNEYHIVIQFSLNVII